MQWFGYHNNTCATLDIQLLWILACWLLVYVVFLWFILTSRRKKKQTFLLGNLTLFSGALLSIGIADINWMTGYGNLLGSYSRWTKLIHGHEDMLVSTDLTVHIGLRQINITLQSRGEGMEFSYNEIIVLAPKLVQDKTQMLEALGRGLPNPILSLMEFFLENKSSRTLEEVGYYSSYFLHAALVVWFINQIVFLMVPELSAKVSFINAIVIALTVFFYAFLLESTTFSIHVEGRKVEVTLGRSIYFVMVSAFLQTIPQVLVLLGAYPRTSFEVDFGTPWDKDAIAEMSKQRLQSTMRVNGSPGSNSTQSTNASTSTKSDILMNITPMNQPKEDLDNNMFKSRKNIPFTSPLTPIKVRPDNPIGGAVECTGVKVKHPFTETCDKSLNKSLHTPKRVCSKKYKKTSSGKRKSCKKDAHGCDNPSFVDTETPRLIWNCSKSEISPRMANPSLRRFSLSHIEDETSTSLKKKISASESLRRQALLKMPRPATVIQQASDKRSPAWKEHLRSFTTSYDEGSIKDLTSGDKASIASIGSLNELIRGEKTSIGSINELRAGDVASTGLLNELIRGDGASVGSINKLQRVDFASIGSINELKRSDLAGIGSASTFNQGDMTSKGATKLDPGCERFKYPSVSSDVFGNELPETHLNTPGEPYTEVMPSKESNEVDTSRIGVKRLRFASISGSSLPPDDETRICRNRSASISTVISCLNSSKKILKGDTSKVATNYELDFCQKI